MKHFKGSASYKRLGTPGLMTVLSRLALGLYGYETWSLVVTDCSRKSNDENIWDFQENIGNNEQS
jgi:hypothetical protein